jgi:4-amino-4-deoxy-L-arabinose transferase-like glycosyltransferase
MPWSLRSPVGWTAVLAVALAARLVAAVVVERIVAATPGRVCLIEGDAEGYWLLAGHMLRGEDYELYQPPRRILRMPGLPAILAGCRAVFGDEKWPVRCLLAAIGAAGCGCVFWLGCELVSPEVGLIAAAAVAVSPALVVFSPLILSESSFATAMTASLIPIAKLLKREAASVAPSDIQARWLPAIAAGLLCAIATYLRPTWFPAAFGAAALIVIVGRFHSARWLEAGVLLAAFVLLYSPWVIRNHAVSGHYVLTTLWVGPSLYDGLRPDANGDSDMTFFDRENLLGRMSEYDMDQEYRRRAWAFAAANPGRAIELAVIKAGRYWSPWPNANQFSQPIVQLGLLVATLPLYAFGLVGLIAHRRDWRLWLLTLGPAVFFSAVHMLFVGSIRYRLPAEMPLWVLATAGVLAVPRWWSQRREAPS